MDLGPRNLSLIDNPRIFARVWRVSRSRDCDEDVEVDAVLRWTKRARNAITSRNMCGWWARVTTVHRGIGRRSSFSFGTYFIQPSKTSKLYQIVDGLKWPFVLIYGALSTVTSRCRHGRLLCYRMSTTRIAAIFWKSQYQVCPALPDSQRDPSPPSPPAFSIPPATPICALSFRHASTISLALTVSACSNLSLFPTPRAEMR